MEARAIQITFERVLSIENRDVYFQSALKFKHILQMTTMNFSNDNASELLLSEIWIQTPPIGLGMLHNPNIPQKSHQLNQYGVDTSQDSSWMFDLNICTDAFVYLSLSPGMDSDAMFQICLGRRNDTMIFLRRRDYQWEQVVEKVIENGITSCNSFLPIWISWEKGHIMIGKGLHVGRHTEIDWKDPNPFTIANIASGVFCVTKETRGRMDLIEAATVSKIECAGICNKYHTCMGFNYHEDMMKCEMITTGVQMITAEELGWVFGTKCFQVTCLGCI
ncbi:unnamed protein product [Mytilus coruscus]|uniref:Farnesoic acid O-methyl transferase domain-containing protein n=1 Tax=Mytilus coruscus TaxID=42192 RepID=A0A6J8ELY1_MYTCO|nr:unnamed protein product [Mytilus coruscus]